MRRNHGTWRDAGSAESTSLLDAIGGLRLAALESKHVPLSMMGAKAELFESLAARVGYSFPRIGMHQGRTEEEDITTVRQMAGVPLRPLKIVVTEDGRMWADNTHTGLALLMKSGHHVSLRNVRFYLVDFRGLLATLFWRPASLIEPFTSISIAKARWIQYRLELGWRPSSVSYTLGELSWDGGYTAAATRAFPRDVNSGL